MTYWIKTNILLMSTNGNYLDEGGVANSAPWAVWAATDSCYQSILPCIFLALLRKGKQKSLSWSWGWRYHMFYLMLISIFKNMTRNNTYFLLFFVQKYADKSTNETTLYHCTMQMNSTTALYQCNQIPDTLIITLTSTFTITECTSFEIYFIIYSIMYGALHGQTLAFV